MKTLFTLLALAVSTVAGHAAGVVFITHPATAEAAVSADEAKNILLGNKTKWGSGPNIKLVILTEGPVHDEVIKDHTQRTADQFDKHWKKLVFTGKGSMPATGKTDAEIIAYVAANPGAFGYVAKDSVTSQVKVLSSQ